jgi:hypothetical protein
MVLWLTKFKFVPIFYADIFLPTPVCGVSLYTGHSYKLLHRKYFIS